MGDYSNITEYDGAGTSLQLYFFYCFYLFYYNFKYNALKFYNYIF